MMRTGHSVVHIDIHSTGRLMMKCALTGFSVCEVRGCTFPSLSRIGFPDLSLFTMSSALPWSAVTTKMPPTCSMASRIILTASSAALHPTMVASRSPVCPTMSAFGMFTRTYKTTTSLFFTTHRSCQLTVNLRGISLSTCTCMDLCLRRISLCQVPDQICH